MKNWVPQKKLVIFTAAAAVISATLYFVCLGAVLFEIKKVENAYNDTESSSSRNKRAQVIKSIAETNAPYVQTLRDFFVHKGDEVRFIEQIEEIGKKSGIEFEIFIEEKPGQSDAFKEDVLVKMSMNGSWSGIMGFLDALHKMYFGVSVQSLKLSVGDSNKWNGFIEFVISREK